MTPQSVTDAEFALVLALRNLLVQTPPLPTTSPVVTPASNFDPAWKGASSNGRQFTQAGVNAIAAMFQAGLSNREIGRRMRIGVGSAATYRERFEGRRPWGRFRPQSP